RNGIVGRIDEKEIEKDRSFPIVTVLYTGKCVQQVRVTIPRKWPPAESRQGSVVHTEYQNVGVNLEVQFLLYSAFLDNLPPTKRSQTKLEVEVEVIQVSQTRQIDTEQEKQACRKKRQNECKVLRCKNRSAFFFCHELPQDRGS